MAAGVDGTVGKSRPSETKEAADDEDAVTERIGLAVQVHIQRRALDGIEIIGNRGRVRPLTGGIHRTIDQRVAGKPEQMANDDDAVGQRIGLAVQIHIEIGQVAVRHRDRGWFKLLRREDFRRRRRQQHPWLKRLELKGALETGSVTCGLWGMQPAVEAGLSPLPHMRPECLFQKKQLRETHGYPP